MIDDTKNLLKRIEDDPALTEAIDSLYSGAKSNSGLHLNIHGMCEEQKGFIAASVSYRLGRKPVLVVPDIIRARMAAKSKRKPSMW